MSSHDRSATTRRRKSVVKPKGRRPKSDGISAKDSIVEAYIDLLLKMGPLNVTADMIARESNVSVTTFRYYFPDWTRDLNFAAIGAMLLRTFEFVEAQMYVHRKNAKFNPLKSYIEIMFDWTDSHRRDASLLAYFYYLASTQVEHPFSNEVFLGRARLRIQSLILEGVALGHYPMPKDRDLAALQIHSTIVGTCLVSGTERAKKDRDRQRAICHDLVLNHILGS